MSRSIAQVLRNVRDRLHGVAGDLALPEAERILCHVLNVKRSDLYLRRSDAVGPANLEAIEDCVEKRGTGMPLAYALTTAYFHSREFHVSPAVLIPRPETEVLVEEILKRETGRVRRFLDMGTGSGNIAGVLSVVRPEWCGVATDLSWCALGVARRNCGDRVALLCADRLECVRRQYRFDFVVSNPPYVSAEEMAHLPHDVAGYEPAPALYGGTDGLDFYRYLAQGAAQFLINGGRVYFEIGQSQSAGVTALLADNSWRDILVKNDLNGRPRIVEAHT